MTQNSVQHPIGVVERDTGIGRDTLRVWERRYGFPTPQRNDRGERVYDEAQLRRLQRIRRLLDQGIRPGKLLPLDDAALDRLETSLTSPQRGPDTALLPFLQAIQDGEREYLQTLLQTRYRELGMRPFILQCVAPLLGAIGEYWAAGSLQVYQEHFAAAHLTSFINAKLAHLPEPVDTTPVLLSTLPGEQHVLGLLMVQALLSEYGLKAVNLGGELPMDQLVRAVAQFGAGVVGLTFSSAYPYKSIRPHLMELREQLHNDVQIWVGGEGVLRLRKLPAGVRKFTRLAQLPLGTHGG